MFSRPHKRLQALKLGTKDCDMAETVETVSRKIPMAMGEAGETWKVWLRWGFTP